MDAKTRRAGGIGGAGLAGTMILALAGCAQYATPGRGVAPEKLADYSIEERFNREPAAKFPAHLAVVRVQDSGYSAYRAESYGKGRYSVLTTRIIETDDDLARIGRMPMVAGIAPLERLLLPEQLDSDKPLRLAAASLRADILLLYSIDTSFRIDGRLISPLSIISLGLLPDREAVVTATAAAALFDVRTGFVYGIAEGTAHETQIANTWSSSEVVEHARLKAETAAFKQMLGELEKTWKQVVERNASTVANQADLP